MYGTTIIMSEHTKERIGEEFFSREIDTIRVKGKTQAIRIYELLDPVSVNDESFRRCIEFFKEGLRHYKNGEFRDALISFQSGQSFKADDGPTNVFINKCDNYILTPPAGSWDGVTTLEFK